MDCRGKFEMICSPRTCFVNFVTIADKSPHISPIDRPPRETHRKAMSPMKHYNDPEGWHRIPVDLWIGFQKKRMHKREAHVHKSDWFKLFELDNQVIHDHCYSVIQQRFAEHHEVQHFIHTHFLKNGQHLQLSDFNSDVLQNQLLD